MTDIETRIAQGSGAAPADLVLRGGAVFCVVTGVIIPGDVAICGDAIVGIGAEYDGRKVIELDGRIMVPGFIDTHCHVESSCITPFEFDRCVTPRGITTAICDPHEIANVIGTAGIDYFQRASTRLLMDLRVQLPSCVPSSHMETSGAVLEAEDLWKLMDHPSGIGLAEVMNYPGVLARDEGLMEKLRLFEAEHIDGHCPQLVGKGLNGYIAGGILTEHEATSEAEAREKLTKGLRVLIREGSVSKDLDALAPLLNEATSAYMCLCTDDRNPLDIAEEGHIDAMIRRLIAKGVSPLAAYRAASLSAAEAFGLKDRGQLAPGKRADIVVLGSLDDCDAEMVFAGGVLATPKAFAARETIPAVGYDSVQCPKITAASFRHAGNRRETDVIGIVPGKIITEHLVEDIPSVAGDKRPVPFRDLARVAVIERHGKNGNIATGFVKGFGIQKGAIAATVAHDHHNIVVIGTDYDDMAKAVRRVSRIQGGFAVVHQDRILAELALPVAGLMSDLPFEEVRFHMERLRDAAKSLGISLEEPFLQLAFVALPVIPALKITDRGMVDVTKFEIIP